MKIRTSRSQIKEVKIVDLIKLAEKDECKSDEEIARWIISASPYWRSEGYNQIMQKLQKIIREE